MDCKTLFTCNQTTAEGEHLTRQQQRTHTNSSPFLKIKVYVFHVVACVASIQFRGILKTERHVAHCPLTFNRIATVSLTCPLVISDVNADVKP